MTNDTGNLAFGGVQRSYSFNRFHADQIPNSLVAVESPDMECEQVFLQNHPDSSGNIIIGSSRLAETGLGFVLEPGDVTGWIPINNLNLIWHLDAADSYLNYMIVR